MTTLSTLSTLPRTPTSTPSAPDLVTRRVAAAVRLSLASVFLWAFADKLLGLGHATPSAGAWVRGGSPTEGFLSKATDGPLSGFYGSLAGAAWADLLFMVGLLAIGTGLLLGVAMRLTAASGALLMVLMWSAVLPPDNHVVMDDHLVYALVLVLLALLGAGRTWGLGARWESLPVVRQHPVLR